MKNLLQKQYFEYVNYAKGQEKKQNSFLKNITSVNKKTGVCNVLSYNAINNFRNNAIYYKAVSDYLSLSSQNNDKKAIFITLTLPSKFHKFKQKKSFSSDVQFILNKKYDNNLSVNLGYNLLLKCFRHLYNKFKTIDKKCVKIKYFRIVEPHKDFTPHLHAVLFIPNFDLHRQFDFEVLNDVSSASSYVLKYIRKQFFNDNETVTYFVSGWASMNKIRLFSSSRTPVPRYIYKILQKNKIDLSLTKYF